MKDTFGREITNIRISITQECDLRCFYCHEEGEDGAGQLDIEDVESILKQASELGMYKVKFSGGESLVHPQMMDIVEIGSRYMNDVSLTTNGASLGNMALDLKERGLDRVNVSLDTLDPETYKEITGKDRVEEVKRGIQRAVEVGLHPVKINMLLMKGLNDDEIEDMIRFSSESGAILQIIEMTANREEISEEYYERYHLPLEDIAEELEERAVEIKQRRMHARKKYFLEEPEVQVELVRTMHNTQFCSNCTRLRVTSEGELKPCLLRTDNHVSIREELDKGADLKEKFIEAIENREPYWSE